MRQDAFVEQERALECCKAQVEQRLGWGDSARWTSHEFEELSVRIQDQTGRVISATTLKRLWGRVTYTSRPSRHSLDTLAIFLGHSAWRGFADTLVPAATAPASPSAPIPSRFEPSSPAHRLPRTALYLFGSIALLGAAVVAWSGLAGSPEKPRAVDPSEVVFSSRPVTQGLPNTVIFEYDVQGVRADSFFIQQSWDNRRRARVSPEGQTFTSTYYEPGYFNAKLLADSVVLAEHGLHITTDGWMALVEVEPVPIYVQEAFTPGEDYLSVSSDWLRERGIDAGEKRLTVSYYNVRSFGPLHMDRFSLTTTLRHGMEDGRYPCKHTQIVVIGERGALMIPLSIPGCVGDLGLMLGDVYLDGSTNDLSALGADLSTWQRTRIDVSGRDVRIQVGANPPFNARFSMDAGRVVGLRIRFEGTGAIDEVTLQDPEGRVVYEESF
ncbi:MAG: hypothetical protein R2834_12875 [Rhodothermales bacterium]